MTLEDGKEEAEKIRGILEQQPQNVRDVHKKLLQSMDMNEEEYWNEYAPGEYQKILSVQNKDFIENLNVSQKQLFNSSLENNTLKVLDGSVRF